MCVWELAAAVIWSSAATETSCRASVRILDRLWQMRRCWCKNMICALDLKRYVLDSCSYEEIIVIYRQSSQPNLYTGVIDIVDIVTVMGSVEFTWPAVINILIRYARVATNSEPLINMFTTLIVSGFPNVLDFCLQVSHWFTLHRIAGEKCTLCRLPKPTQFTETVGNVEILRYLVIEVNGVGGEITKNNSEVITLGDFVSLLLHFATFPSLGGTGRWISLIFPPWPCK